MSNQEKKTLFKILGFFCFVLILPFPTGFYYLSRAIVFAGAIYAASVIKDLKSSKGETIYLLMIAIAFIYNPILMVFLYQKAIWIVINIISALVFFNAASLFNNSQTGKIPTANRKTKPIVSRQKGINNSRVKARSKSTNNYPYELKMDSFPASQDYLKGEVVQLNGIYVGEVLSWDSIFYVLRLENVDRKLLKGDYLLGERSNANFSIIAIDPIEKKVNEDQLQLFSREETISEQEEIAETTIDDSDRSLEEHNQRMKEQNNALYGSEKVSSSKEESKKYLKTNPDLDREFRQNLVENPD